MIENTLFNQLYRRFHAFTLEAGLNNELVSARPDPTRDNALILTVTTAFPPTLDKHIEALKTHLYGEVFDIRFGDAANYTEFGFRPWKGTDT